MHLPLYHLASHLANKDLCWACAHLLLGELGLPERFLLQVHRWQPGPPDQAVQAGPHLCQHHPRHLQQQQQQSHGTAGITTTTTSSSSSSSSSNTHIKPPEADQAQRAGARQMSSQPCQCPASTTLRASSTSQGRDDAVVSAAAAGCHLAAHWLLPEDPLLLGQMPPAYTNSCLV